MPRRGKDLELLVASLERLVARSDATVTSPDFLLDRTTGERREVDVSVRSRVGSAEVIVIFECRDWSAPQCVVWIEQLALKRNDVQAAKAVAVSSSGFSSAAVKKAKAHGIELRRIDEIDLAAVASWCRVAGFTVTQNNFDFIDFGIGLRGSRAVAPHGGVTVGPLRDATFVRLADGIRMNARELVMMLDPEARLWRELPTDGSKVRRKLRFDFAQLQLSVALLQGTLEHELAGVELELELWRVQREIPLHRVLSYRNDEESCVESVEYLIELDGTEEIIAISRDLRAGKQYVTRRPVVPGTPLPDGWIRTDFVRLDSARPHSKE